MGGLVRSLPRQGERSRDFLQAKGLDVGEPKLFGSRETLLSKPVVGVNDGAWRLVVCVAVAGSPPAVLRCVQAAIGGLGVGAHRSAALISGLGIVSGTAPGWSELFLATGDVRGALHPGVVLRLFRRGDPEQSRGEAYQRLRKAPLYRAPRACHPSGCYGPRPCLSRSQSPLPIQFSGAVP